MPHASTRSITAVLLSAALCSPAVFAQDYKHVAVEPAAIANQQLQSPERLGVFSHATLVPINKLGDHELRLDSPETTPVVLLGPDVQAVDIRLVDPDGQTHFQTKADEPTPSRQLALGDIKVASKDLPLLSHKPGRWRLDLASGSPSSVLSRTHYALLKGDPNFKLYSYRDNASTLLNSRVHLVAHMLDATEARKNRRGERRGHLLEQSALPATIEQAQVTLTSPSGVTRVLMLNDEGRDGDAVAQDGRYTVQLPTEELGVYSQELQVTGTRPDGLAFSRTTMDLYPVIEQSFRLTDKPAQLQQDGDDLFVHIPVHSSGAEPAVFAAAEIWGKGPRGVWRQLTWVGGIAEPNANGDLVLALDARWLAQTQAPYQLRGLRLQQVDNHTPMASADVHTLSTDRSALASTNRTALKVTGQNLAYRSVNTAPELTQQEVSPMAAGSVLMLVHGYCSSNAWDTNHFSNAVEFKDYKANRSHDAFAKKIRDAGAGYNSFGVVAHSQGGAAALHLYAKYMSGLDNASGGRLIQSVGTPYQGTALAGNLAVLGQVFGAGCGKNTDLTYSGAANWLATIPSWARSQVDYYTTSFKDRWWAYDYCHLATDLLLDDPDDGTTEKWSGQLSGAVNKGHKTGWCHTGGMRDPAQTRDTSRNSSMSSRAAR